VTGELFDDHVLVSDEKEASAIYNRGYYGTPQSGGALKLALIEAAYLVETDKLGVRKSGKEIGLEKMMRLSHKFHPNFEIKYIVYRDLRQRGYVVKLGEGVDFRLYPRGGIPSKTPSKYWVLAISERVVFDLNRLLEHTVKTGDLRKDLLLAVVDEESDITYYGIKLVKPVGSQPREREGKGIEGLLMNDRVVVLNREDAETLHKPEFFGRMVGTKYLQLSLIETAYLLENGILSVRNSKTGKTLDLEKFERFANRLQKDFDLRLRIYRDLKNRGIVAKTGFKYGAHFRGYEKDPDSTHARYLVHAVPDGYVSSWSEISRAVRLAHGVKKDIVFGKWSGDTVEYVGLRRLRP
jgi:tRNA-intron endonuclease